MLDIEQLHGMLLTDGGVFCQRMPHFMRLDILHKVLPNVCHERQYLKQIKKLYDVERCDLMTLEEYVFLNDVFS